MDSGLSLYFFSEDFIDENSYVPVHQGNVPPCRSMTESMESFKLFRKVVKTITFLDIALFF